MLKSLWSRGVLLAVFGVSLWAIAEPTPPVIPGDTTAALDLVGQLWNLIVTKQYALLLGPVVALLVYALRRWDVLIPKVGPQVDAFLNKPFVAFLLPLLVSTLGGVGTALAAHQPVVEIIKSVFEAAMSAVFTYVGLKKATEKTDAGAAAAAGVTDKAAAVTELKQP